MSEIKNPFLDNGLDKNDSLANSNSAEGNDIYTAQTTPEVKNNNTPKLDDNNDKFNVNSTTPPQTKELDEDNIMEIKKDSNLLKNIIITLIILLILAILGLVLWNFLNKNKIKTVNNNNQEQKTVIETPSFEMSGNSFRASSVVIE